MIDVISRIREFAFLAVLSLITIVLAFGSSPAFAKGISGNTVKIGLLTDMTGVFSDLAGKGSVVAMQMAVDDFLKNEKPDFKVETVIGDHQNKTDIATNIARDWYDNKKVDVITGLINSGVALAVSEVARDKNRLELVTGSGSTPIYSEKCSPNTVLYAWTTDSFAGTQGKYLTAAGLKTWYFAGVDYVFGHSLVKDASRAVEAGGGKVLGSTFWPLGSSDLSAPLIKAAASKADVIGIATAGAGMVEAARLASKFGLTKKQKIAGLGATFADVHAMGPKVAQGMVLVEGFYWDADQTSRAFSERYFKRAGKMPSMLNTAVYSAVTQYLKTVKEIGSDDVRDVLDNWHNRSAFNDLFLRNGHLRPDNLMVHDVYLVEVKSPDQSKSEWDLYNIKKDVPGVEAYPPLSESRCPLLKNKGNGNE